MRRAASSTPGITTPGIARFVPPLTVFVFAAFCFAGAVRHEFLRGDDIPLLVDNSAYRGLGPSHLRWMFTTFLTGPYQPLSWISYAVDWSVWGLRPIGFHLTNVVLHAATALAVYFLAIRLLRAAVPDSSPSDPSLQIASAFAALLFALHPQRVESVAWITERRDVLSGLFYVVALLAYVRFATSDSAHRRRFYLVALAAYLLSVLAKATGMTLPIILILLDAWPLRRLNRHASVWIEKLPFIAVGVVTGIVAVVGQRSGSFVLGFENLSIAQRVAVAAFAACFYLWKMLLPFGLSPLYERPAEIVPASPIFVGCIVTIAIAIALILWSRRRAPAVAVVLTAYFVTLAPVSGLVLAGNQIAADRYTYLPTLGFALLAGGIVLRLLRSSRRPATIAVCASVLVVYAMLTIRQTRFWADDWTLWQRGAAVHSPFGPSPKALANASMLAAERGNLDLAIRYSQQAVEARPRDSSFLRNHATYLNLAGRTTEALQSLQLAADAAPQSATAQSDYAAALHRAGRATEAEPVYERAIALDAADAQANFGLGLICIQHNRTDRADRLMASAISSGRLTPEMYVQVASAWFTMKEPSRAVKTLRAAVERHPNDEYLAIMLAWPLATHPLAEVRNGADAVRLVRPIAARPGDNRAQALRALAAALAEIGDFPGATAASAELIRLVTQDGRVPVPAALAQFDSDLRAGRPVRQTP